MAEIVLTPGQRAAVESRGCALLVAAAAGSGKTRVLIDRVLDQVIREGRCVDEFLLITFTQAAAAELRGKLLAELNRRLAADPENRHLQRQLSRVYLAQISTVHSFCAALLRDYAHVLELPADFRLADEQEAAALRERAVRAVLEEAYADPSPAVRAALDLPGAGRDDRALQELIVRVYTNLQCYPDPAATADRWEVMLDVTDCTDPGQTIWGEWLLRELQRGLQSDAAMLRRALALAEENEAVSAYAPVLQANLLLLEALASAGSWEALARIPPDFGRFPAIRKCADPETQERIKRLRTDTVARVRRRLEPFSLQPDETLRELSGSAEALRGLLALTRAFSARFAAEKSRRHLLDYNDLEHFALRLLTDRSGAPTAAAREVAGRYAEILVDEYQDTNRVQEAIYSAISREGRNVFLVGDVKQSIYRFRLADPTIFLEKYRTFAEEPAEGEPRRILLSDNFRSHAEILSAANDVFRLTMTERTGGLAYGDDEALRANRTFPDMGQPAVELHAIDYSPAGDGAPPDRAAAEAEFVAARIAEMLRQEERIPDGDGLRPVRPGDIVILMRSLSGRTQTYLDALRRHGIPASCGSDDLFAAEEIRFLFALLRIIDNPHQDIPLLTVLLSPFGGYPADALARLRAGDRDADLYTLLCESKAPICAVLEDLRRTAQEAPLRTLLEEAEERLLLPALCAALPNGPQRQRNLAAFRSIADSYERAGGCGLPGFLRHLEGLRERGVPSSGGAAAGAVRLMTIHSSKGLEFPVVFLADLCKSFNRTDSRANVLTDPVLGLGSNCYDPAARILCPTIARQAIARRLDQEAVSEEMRVLYVAMTRPQYRLIMTCCAARLTRRLESYAQGLSLPPDAALLEGADSLGDWILLAAMTRPEAGELFAAAGQPDCALQGGHPWRIQLHTAVQAAPEAGTAASAEPACEQPPEPRFLPPYGHAAAVAMPTKLTATQLKGRELDNEAAEQTAQAPKLHFPVPRFEEGRRALTAAERGTALHLAMQHLNYAACADESGLRLELERLGRQKFLTPQQLEAVDPERLRRFFASPLGQRVLQAPQVVREFKFSVLDDGANYDPALEGEEILLQGVTDCCLIELNGLVILDFKSDRLRPGAERERAEYYRGQLDAYSRALSRIFELPVSERIVYFFATDTAVSL